MRLYLSSYGLGNKPEELVALAQGKMRVAVIANAADTKTEHDRIEAVEGEIRQLSELGFEASEVDLRHYFGKAAELREAIAQFDVLWMRGGNTFNLRRALNMSGFDTIIRELLQEDAVVYAGYSAGIDMLAPSLHGVELVDPPDEIPEGYDSEIIWECLGLLPYTVAPHYKSDHHESEDIDKTIEYMIDNHIVFVALRDGEVLIIDGSSERIVA